MFFSKIFGPFPESAGRLAAIALVFGVSAGEAFAGTWTQPLCPNLPNGDPDLSCRDRFASRGTHYLDLGGSTVGIELTGPTTVFHDRVDEAFFQDGRDTINTEITLFDLQGNALGHVAGLRAGAGTTFLPGGVGLDHTRGQVRDQAGAPLESDPNDPSVRGTIQFPAESIFDVFFDLWIDFNDDNQADVGEVFSNDLRDANGNVDPLSFALRMTQPYLRDIPPPGGTIYLGDTGVWAFAPSPAPTNRNPELGTFQAIPSPLPFLYPILPTRECRLDNNFCVAVGQLTGQATHEVAPEIDAAAGTGALSLLAGALALVGERRRRNAAPD